MRALHTFYFGSFALHGLEALKFGTLWAGAFVAVGIFEESFSRGYAQATLAQGLGFWPAALLNSLIFGAVHISNSGESALVVASVVCVAMFFCLTLWWTGSLWFAVGIHTGWDYAETFIFGVADSGEQASGHVEPAPPREPLDQRRGGRAERKRAGLPDLWPGGSGICADLPEEALGRACAGQKHRDALTAYTVRPRPAKAMIISTTAADCTDPREAAGRLLGQTR